MPWPAAGKASGQILIVNSVRIDRVETDQGLIGAHHHKQPHIACFRQLFGCFLEKIVDGRHTTAEAGAVVSGRIKGLDDVRRLWLWAQ